MRLRTQPEPFEHDDWLFELKLDGYRALAEIRDGRCRLVSRNLNVYKRFDPLCAELARTIGKDCLLDGEIVSLDGDGRPQFYDLLRGRGIACYVAFDILHLGKRDLRKLPLVDRKAILERVVPDRGRVLRAKSIPGNGVDLFRLVCANDLEGIVAKHKHGAYIEGREGSVRRSDTSWFKIKNPTYSQADMRHELFGSRRAVAIGVS
jgi:bifunctional non-homologous end joining protein LigD